MGNRLEGSRGNGKTKERIPVVAEMREWWPGSWWWWQRWWKGTKVRLQTSGSHLGPVLPLILDNVWRHFCCQNLEEVLLASHRQRPGMLLTPLQYTGQRLSQPKMSVVLRLKIPV